MAALNLLCSSVQCPECGAGKGEDKECQCVKMKWLLVIKKRKNLRDRRATATSLLHLYGIGVLCK